MSARALSVVTDFAVSYLTQIELLVLTASCSMTQTFNYRLNFCENCYVRINFEIRNR